MDLLDDQVINLGTITQKQTYNLIVQALSVTTTHEKDKLIHEVKNPWKTHNQCLQQLCSWNEKMLDTLSKLEIKSDNKIKEYNTLLMNTSFQQELQKHSFTSKEKTDLITTIKDIENEIQKIIPLQTQSNADAITDLNVGSFLKLKDIKFKRLEELSHALKKKAIVFDESEDLSNEISTKYGNLKNLLQVHENLKKENQELKEEELTFIHDSMVKRRNTSHLPLTWISNIILILQSELSAQNLVYDSLPLKSHLNDNSQITLNLDLLFPSFSQSITFSKPDFSTTINKDTTSNLLSASSPQEKLSALKNVIKEQENTIEHLSNELEPLRQLRYSENETFVTQEREQRLWSLHDKLQMQVHDYQEKINDIYNESTSIYNQIIMTINQKKLYGETESEWIRKFQNLQNDHALLNDMVLHNEAVCTTLYDLSNSFGTSMMDKPVHDNHESDLNDYFKNEFSTYLATSLEVKSQVHSPPNPPVDNEDENDPMKKMRNIRSLMLSKKLKKRSSERKDRTTSASISSKSNRKKHQETQISHFSYHNPIENATKVEILNYLSLVTDINSKIKGDNTSYHSYVSGKLHYLLGELRPHFYSEIRNYIEDIKENMKDIAKYGDPILRIPRVDVEVMAETEPKTEIDVQTDEIEVKGKKGKSSIKPPSKSKAKDGGRKLKK